MSDPWRASPPVQPSIRTARRSHQPETPTRTSCSVPCCGRRPPIARPSRSAAGPLPLSPAGCEPNEHVLLQWCSQVWLTPATELPTVRTRTNRQPAGGSPPAGARVARRTERPRLARHRSPCHVGQVQRQRRRLRRRRHPDGGDRLPSPTHSDPLRHPPISRYPSWQPQRLSTRVAQLPGLRLEHHCVIPGQTIRAEVPGRGVPPVPLGAARPLMGTRAPSADS